MIAQLSYGWTIMAFPLRTNGGRSPAAEFAQDFGNQSVSMTASLKVVQRPGLRPARRDRAGGLYSAV